MLTNSSPLIVRLKLRLAPYKFLRFVSFLAAFFIAYAYPAQNSSFVAYYP